MSECLGSFHDNKIQDQLENSQAGLFIQTLFSAAATLMGTTAVRLHDVLRLHTLKQTLSRVPKGE